MNTTMVDRIVFECSVNMKEEFKILCIKKGTRPSDALRRIVSECIVRGELLVPPKPRTKAKKMGYRR